MQRRIDFKRLSNEYESKDYEEYPEQLKQLYIGKLWHIFTTIWSIVGLFTFNWVAFAVFIFFNIIVIEPIGKLIEFTKSHMFLLWVNSVIGLLWAVFIILNTYHLKIDLFELLKSWM